MERINTRKLNSVGTQNATAKRISKILSMRERASKFTNLAAFRHLMKKEFGYNYNRTHFDQYWRDLAELGLGKILLSPQKLPTRYDWDGWDSQSVGAAALDPAKHPERAKFRTRRSSVKKDVGALGQPMVASPQPVEGELLPAIQDPIPGVDATKIFAMFMTQNSEAIKLELNQGLTRVDRDKLIGLLNRLPVREAS